MKWSLRLLGELRHLLTGVQTCCFESLISSFPFAVCVDHRCLQGAAVVAASSLDCFLLFNAHIPALLYFCYHVWLFIGRSSIDVVLDFSLFA